VPFHPLANNDVHLWFLPEGVADIEQLCAASLNLLMPDELQRYQSFRNSNRAKQFLLGRSLLRHSLAAHLAVDVSALQFSYGANGKPELPKAIIGDLVFSLSHAGCRAVVAIASGERIGVDLEMASRATAVLGIAQQFYSAAEKRQLESDGATAAQEALALWGLKESIVKAGGETIWRGLSEVQLALDEERIQWLSAPPDGPASNWFLMCGRYSDECMIALAVQRKQKIFRVQTVCNHILGRELANDNPDSSSLASSPVSTN
jgi:4'-phosphopantetheinyl transferase